MLSAPSLPPAAQVASMNEFGFENLNAEKAPIVVFVASSTGDGDPPDNSAKFYMALRRKSNANGLLKVRLEPYAYSAMYPALHFASMWAPWFAPDKLSGKAFVSPSGTPKVAGKGISGREETVWLPI